MMHDSHCLLFMSCLKFFCHSSSSSQSSQLASSGSPCTYWLSCLVSQRLLNNIIVFIWSHILRSVLHQLVVFQCETVHSVLGTAWNYISYFDCCWFGLAKSKGQRERQTMSLSLMALPQLRERSLNHGQLVQSHIFRNISSVSRTVAGLEETASSPTEPVLLQNQVVFHMHH